MNPQQQKGSKTNLNTVENAKTAPQGLEEESTSCTTSTSPASKAIAWGMSQLESKRYRNYCQRFVRLAFEHAGVVCTVQPSSACEAANLWLVDTSMESIPFGATVYFNGSTPDGHVGIHLGGWRILHAAETVRIDNLASLLHLGYRGYGFQAGVALYPADATELRCS